MSWVPPNLASSCSVLTTVSTCQPASFLFLQLVVDLFGRSPDSSSAINYSDYGLNSQEYSDFIDQNVPRPEVFWRQEDDLPRRREYDFIVIGAGSAGCVLSNRLTENPEWTVLLLEAGEEEPDAADVPAFAPILQTSSIDWNYMTMPQPNACRARPQGRCVWARGRVMGGTSSINYLIYIRGNPLDYDEWEQLGNPGWGYRNVFPYFLKSESNMNLDQFDERFHGTSGPLTVGYFPYQDQNIYTIINGFKDLGYKELDSNAGQQIGTMLMQHTHKDGVRMSLNRAYIRPIRNKRKNLFVRPFTNVIRVLINPTTKTAYGVEVQTRSGKIERIFARKEVIVSGGSINSAKILMLSGVGPREHLTSLGIRVIQDLRVGFNLQDHTTVDGVVFRLSNRTATVVQSEQQRQDAYFFRDTHRGPLACTGPLQANAFVQTRYADDPYRPDIQYSFDALNVDDFITDPILTSQTAVTPLAYYTGFMVRPIMLNPKSRGIIMLNSTDPINGPPLIFANTYNDPRDLLTLVAGMKQSLQLLETETFRKAGITLETTPLPACSNYPFGTDDYWYCVATEYTTTIYHPVGSNKMGPREDKNAVVDSRLRVYGIKNLRVIDSSIMPIVVRGNTNAPTVMIAEMGADFIKERWLKKGKLALKSSFVNFIRMMNSPSDFKK